jgi:hypothetical protein
MQEIGTPQICSHIMNLYIKRQKVTVNWSIGSRKKAIFQSNILELADKKSACNDGRL